MIKHSIPSYDFSPNTVHLVALDLTRAIVLQDGTFEYVKIHIKSNQGNQYLTSAEARQRAGTDPDYMTRSLYEDIEEGKFPSWDVYGQIISPEVAEKYSVNIFDPTKTLPSNDFPYRPFGRIVLNRNVADQFAEVEQAAFSPTNVVPGWALSPDPSKHPPFLVKVGE